MNALVPQGKTKKNLGRKTSKPEPVPSERRRILGFLLVLLAAFILLPELSFLSDADNEPSSKAQIAYLRSLPDQEPWPEAPEMQEFSEPVTATRVPEAELATYQSQWVKDYVKAPVPPAPVESVSSSPAQTQSKPLQNSPAFMVQVATLSSQPNADALVVQLQGLGYRSFIREKGPYHQVIIGPQLRRQDAELALNSIQKDLALKGIIKSYRP